VRCASGHAESCSVGEGELPVENRGRRELNGWAVPFQLVQPSFVNLHDVE
jgi:hypothetical protein